jgi:hypothetical protein
MPELWEEDGEMKCKIKYQIAPCHNCPEECIGIMSMCKSMKKYARYREKGFEGEIREYEIEDNGYTQDVSIVINNRRKIELCEDWYGVNEDEGCPNRYDIIDYLEIDGKVIVSDKEDEEVK